MRITINFSIDQEQDIDIYRWLKSLPRGEKSNQIRQGLRQYIGQQEISLVDIYQAIMDLKRCGVTVPERVTAKPDEPADLAANLDRLGA